MDAGTALFIGYYFVVCVLSFFAAQNGTDKTTDSHVKIQDLLKFSILIGIAAGTFFFIYVVKYLDVAKDRMI